jgi:site-specific recombinase XerD
VALKKYSGPAGKWRARFVWKGKEHTRVVRTQREGREWIATERKRLEQQAKLRSKGLMYSELCGHYLTECEARVQPSTVGEKYGHLTSFGAWLGSDMPVVEITPQMARESVKWAYEQRGAKAVNRMVTRSLRPCWKWGMKVGHAADNPWSWYEPFPEDEPEVYIPPAEDVAKVLLQASKWERDFLDCLMTLAARPSEIRQMAWEDISLEHKAVRLWTRKRKGGKRQSRVLPMSPKLHAVLKRRWEKRDKERAHVFVNPETGKPYGRLSHPMRYMMERLCEAAKVKPFGHKSLRHYTAQLLSDSGKAGLREIQTFLGHQRPTTTDIYLKSLRPELAHLGGVLDEIHEQEKDTENDKVGHEGGT